MDHCASIVRDDALEFDYMQTRSHAADTCQYLKGLLASFILEQLDVT